MLSRHHPDVDDGWTCDKGRFGYQSIHADERITEPLVRDGGELRPVSWERALDAAAALGRHTGRVGALVGGQTTNEEGFLLGRLMREGLESPHLDVRPGGGGLVPLDLARALAHPTLQANVPDVEFAHTVLVLGTEPVDDMPILDLRIRKGVRRRGVRLAVATSRPSSLDANAQAVCRFTPGGTGAFLQVLDAVLTGGDDGRIGDLAGAAGALEADVRAVAELLTSVGEDVVIVWGERLAAGPNGADALRALLNVAGRLELNGNDGAGLLEVPVGTNGRGLREAGCLPNAGPGYGEPGATGMPAGRMPEAVAGGELTALYLLHADPLRDQPDRERWEQALDKAAVVVAHASLLTDGLREHADVIFPAEAYAEKEGTLVHPDGRIQRLRQAIGRPAGTRMEWQVIAEIAERVGLDLGVLTGGMASQQLFAAVPFYAGLSLDAIGGQGLRWPETVAAAGLPAGTPGPFDVEPARRPEREDGALRLGTYHSVWAAPEVEASPALEFLAARQRAELSPEDAARLGIVSGQRVTVSGDGAAVEAEASVRAAVPPGTVFLEEGTAENPANALTAPWVEVHAAHGGNGAGNGTYDAARTRLAPLGAGGGPEETAP